MSAFLDGRWSKMKGVLVQIDSGITPAVWGVDPQDNIYTRKNGNWKKVKGKLVHVSTGAAGTWGVNRGQYVYYYSYRGWKRVSGRLKQIDSGLPGIVCGVNKNDYVYCVKGINPSRPYGTGWTRLPGSLKYISCGALGHWGVNRNNDIYFRYGVSSRNPRGSRWKHVGGKLHQIETGPNGAVWGVHLVKGVYTRLGISRGNPIGRRWKGFAKKKLVHIAVGLGKLYGIDRKGKPYSGDARLFVGRNGLPRRPTGKIRFKLLYVIFNQNCTWLVSFDYP